MTDYTLHLTLVLNSNEGSSQVEELGKIGLDIYIVSLAAICAATVDFLRLVVPDLLCS